MRIFVSEEIGYVDVRIQRKRIKNVHLKVSKDLSVRVSAPMRTSDKWLEEFLQSRATWIDKQLTKFKAAKEKYEEKKIPKPTLDRSEEKAKRKEIERLFYNEMLRIHSEIFEELNVPIPSLTVRKMKTLWGSCNKAKKKITLNQHLINSDLECLQYVILHELTHMIYRYHNKEFYDFIEVYMPDWKARRQRLNKEYSYSL
ncbi:MAG: M48 family metallopeptidase [Anaerovoracaceae bacterium]